MTTATHPIFGSLYRRNGQPVEVWEPLDAHLEGSCRTRRRVRRPLRLPRTGPHSRVAARPGQGAAPEFQAYIRGAIGPREGRFTPPPGRWWRAGLIRPYRGGLIRDRGGPPIMPVWPTARTFDRAGSTRAAPLPAGSAPFDRPCPHCRTWRRVRPTRLAGPQGFAAAFPDPHGVLGPGRCRTFWRGGPSGSMPRPGAKRSSAGACRGIPALANRLDEFFDAAARRGRPGSGQSPAGRGPGPCPRAGGGDAPPARSR